MSRLWPHLLLCFAACASMSRGQPPASASTSTSTSTSGNEQEPAAQLVGEGASRADGGQPVDGRADGRDAQGGPAGSAPSSGSGSSGAGAATGPATGSAADPAAEAALAQARALFERGDPQAQMTLEAFVARYPRHVGRGSAEILLGRLALGRGEPTAAKVLLDPLVGAGTDARNPTEVSHVARYLLGLAELRLGNTSRARTLLLPYAPRSGAGDPAPGDDGAVELRGALGEASVDADPVAALDLWESYMRVAREYEKAWARGRATEAGGRISPEAAWRAYGAAPPAGLTRAVLGPKAAAYLRSRGDAAGAAFIESEVAGARHAMGFDLAAPRVGPGDPNRIGLSLPLSGKFQVVGEAVLRAAMLAAGAPGVNGSGSGIHTGSGVANASGSGAGAQLIFRDTATDSERAAAGVADLTRAEAVIGIISAASARTGGAAIGQATQDGIAMLALEDTAPGALTTAFQIVHAPEARAAALARQALQVGVRRFAMLGPDSTSGRRMREAFARAVVAGGGTVVAESTYVSGATSFSGSLGPLRRTAFEAVFVPDSAERLPLIAPALAVADLWPQPWVKVRGSRPSTAKGQPRPILLLSTASELTHKLVEVAGRYVQGALLCPGFFGGLDDPRAREFVEAYRSAFGQEPHATEAYAYDAVATLRTLTGRGAHTRAEVVTALGMVGPPLLQGLTGDVKFGPDHGRMDPPLVYQVDGDTIRLASRLSGGGAPAPLGQRQ